MNKVFELLIEDLNNNDDWYLNCYGANLLKNNRNDIEIWMSNVPVFDTNVWRPNPMKLNLWQKFRLYQAAKKSIDNAILKELNKSR